MAIIEQWLYLTCDIGFGNSQVYLFKAQMSLLTVILEMYIDLSRSYEFHSLACVG
uniref:Uncharacterized protein n=1 Tax=Arundo donax TaxID=35708 RepID=A0A0A9ANB4_ARUDO